VLYRFFPPSLQILQAHENHDLVAYAISQTLLTNMRQVKMDRIHAINIIIYTPTLFGVTRKKKVNSTLKQEEHMKL
jgi:hypothetical protein